MAAPPGLGVGQLTSMGGQLDTRHLRAVLAVEEHGSFTEAARHLFMAQSTLSRQVKALERELGSELFQRGAGRAAPTPHGRLFLVEARRVMAAVAAAERAARGGR